MAHRDAVGVEPSTPSDGWPALPEAEMALLCTSRRAAAVAALADFIEDRVVRHRRE